VGHGESSSYSKELKPVERVSEGNGTAHYPRLENDV
jgi:hypothetical protein